MTLTPSVVEFFAVSMKQPESLPMRFKDELLNRNLLMADEVFFPTIIIHHYDFKHTLPKLSENRSLIGKRDMFAIRYERMDEHVPDPDQQVVTDQRYEVPESLEDVIDVPRPWGPYYLGTYDLAKIKDSGALFIRKVSKELDPNLLHLLPVNHKDEIPHIEWPNEINLSAKIEAKFY